MYGIGYAQNEFLLHQKMLHMAHAWAMYYEFLCGRRPSVEEIRERYDSWLDQERGYVLVEGEVVEVPLALPAHGSATHERARAPMGNSTHPPGPMP